MAGTHTPSVARKMAALAYGNSWDERRRAEKLWKNVFIPETGLLYAPFLNDARRSKPKLNPI